MLMATGLQKFETINSAVGRLALQQAGKHSIFTADYSGGVRTYNHNSDLDTSMHELGVTYTYRARRWSWLLDDRANYLPESTFGYGGFGWTGSLGPSVGGASGSNLANLNPMFSSNQLLNYGRGSRITNSATTQLELTTSPHSSFTLAGNYGLLQFRESGATNSRNAMFNAGYNRALSARGTIGVTYAFNTVRFLQVSQSFQVHMVEIDYGRQITGRMTVQAGGGGQLQVFHNPLAGSSTSPTWIAHGGINYNVMRNGFTLSYSHYVTNGGGALPGANAQTTYFRWSRQLTRHVSGTLGPGYSRSTSLAQTTSGKARYDAVYGQVNLSRSLGRNTSIFLTYEWQNQAALCTTATCGASWHQHLMTVGFDWHRRQLTVD
jgi:hypothetical protein